MHRVELVMTIVGRFSAVLVISYLTHQLELSSIVRYRLVP
jgi:hypothetical protein